MSNDGCPKCGAGVDRDQSYGYRVYKCGTQVWLGDESLVYVSSDCLEIQLTAAQEQIELLKSAVNVRGNEVTLYREACNGFQPHRCYDDTENCPDCAWAVNNENGELPCPMCHPGMAGKISFYVWDDQSEDGKYETT